MANNPHSAKFKAYLARRRAERRAAQAAREQAGGDWRDGHWLTGESFEDMDGWEDWWKKNAGKFNDDLTAK